MLNISISRGLGLVMAMIVALAVSAALGLTISHAQSNNGSTGKPVAAAPPTLSAPSTIPAGVSSRLAALRGQTLPASAADRAALAAVEHAAASSHFGLVDAQARRVNTGAAGQPIFLVPGNGYACLSGQDVGNTCVSQVDLAKNAPSVSYGQCGTVPQGKLAFYGIVPDGIADLRMHRGDDAGEAVPITGNSFFTLVDVDGANLPTSLSWNDPSGKLGTLSLQLPSDISTAQCAPAAG